MQCLQRWVAQCTAMHKQRLRDIKSRIDTAEPECIKILSDICHNPKRAQPRDRQYEVDLVGLASKDPAKRLLDGMNEPVTVQVSAVCELT